ncbi:hypothetical protein, conserved [Leishmania donovani]|uniref:Uncharacterized protein n=1 Tax=Leishmania donovani TaxID=5661 RepID=E9BUQ5_LEIDO|nr:hypothetical protein, conserved [Leishmania donovani]CBZ38984.1 hypothetical protein, conserved [Leishmania donovani]
MSFMEEMSDAPVSITGEMWLCADSAGPLKVGAGRGLKNFITIEKDRFCAYSSRSEQSKQIKQIAFRSMKRVAWFTHHPKLPGRELAASTTAATLRRGARKDPLAATYYYLVLEFLRDNTIPGTVSLGKRERIVLCTDDHQDFSIWRKFAELYECPPVHEGFVEGRDKKTLRAQAPAGGARDHDDTTSSDDDDYEGRDLGGGSAVGRRSLDLWKNRCVALVNDFAHLSNPSLQVENADVFDTPASCGGLDWDVHVESVLHAIEQDMRPSMKVVPAHSTRGAAAGPSSLLSSPSIAPSSIHPCAATKGMMETGSDEMHSLASNLQVELEQFQAFAAEVGALVEGRELKTTKISPDALNAYVERLRKMPTPAEPADSVAAQRGDKTEANAGAAAADLAKLESACVNAVRSFREKVHTSVLPLSQEWNREKAEQQERAALPQRVETTVAVLIDELARATADVSTLKESLATSIIPTTVSSATSVPLELNELRRVLNQKELEVETLQQKHFDASRHTKQLSRRLEELVFSYSDVAHDMLRSQYREYASLRNLFLRALRGEVSLDNSTPAEASLGASGSFGGMSEACCSSHLSASSGVQKLVISAAHLEAIHALEQERAAARERQRELEEVVKELEVLRQERDEEIANLKCNFLAAGEAWEKDVAILQAKLSALQSAIPRGALLLPASSLATNTAVKAGIAQKLQSTQPHTPTGPAGALESTETVTPLFAEGHKALHKLTTLLTTTPKETVLEAAVVSQRLQAFYDWALEAVVPLSSTSVSDGSVLEMITNVVHAYHALLQQTSTIYTATKSDTDDTHVDVLRLMRNEHEQFRKLWGILEEHLLIHGAGSFHDSGHQQSSERMALSFSSPPTMEELDQLPPFIETLCTNAALYSKLKIRSGGVPIATYIQDLEKKSAQLEQQLQHKEQEERSLSALIATFQDNNTPLFSSHANSPLAALGADAPASPSVAEAIARAAADAAERERALRAEVAAAEERLQAMEERLEAASAEQQQLQADRDAKLRDWVTERFLYGWQMCLRALEAEELESRYRCVVGCFGICPYVAIASSEAEKMLEIRGMVGGSADEVVRRVRALLAELNSLRAFAREAQEKVFWYEDVRVRVPLIKLSDFVREREGTGECYHRDDASVPFLAETLRNSFQALQCLDSEALALRESFSSMKALVKECGTAVNESVEALRKALPRAACVENASPSQPQSTLPVEWGLRVACRGLAASVSEAVHWQGELTNIVKATYRILIASSGGTGVHGAPVSHCDNPSFAEYSQLPRLAAQACSERLHSRRSASVEDELAAVTQQRNDLAGTVGACCGSLRSAISVTTPGRVGSLPATATSLTCDEAKSALRDITVLTSSILHDYAQSMEHTLAVLTPLASIAANTADASSSFEMLAAATEAVRARIKHMERCQLHHLHVRQCGEEGNAKARRSMQDQLFALSEVFEAGELARRNEQKEEAVPLADVAQQQQPWDAVVEVLSKFAEDVGATVRAQNGSESQNVDNAEVLSPVRQAISLSASAKTQEELQGRLSGILDACKRRAAEHHWAEATEGRMALDREDLRASVTTGEHSLEKMQAQVNEYQKPMATMEAARAALGQSTTQMQLVAARALEETLDFGLRERAASESGARAPTGMGERLGEEMYLVQPRMDAMQDRLNDTEVRDSSQVMDAGVLLEAAGQVRSLEDVMRIVSSYSLEYKTKSLEFKESRLRSEIVQDWAAMMVPSAIELRLLRAIVAGVDRPLPGTALADLPAHGSSMRRELTEAEHLLGAAVSDPCAEEATREALLGAMGQACQLLLEAPPERALDTAARHGTASSAEECPAVTAADAVSTTDVGRGTAPNKLADTVYAVIEECGDRAAANGTLCTGEEWYSSVARVTQTLCSALSSAGVAVAVPGDHSLMAGHPSCVSPASQPSMLHSLVSAAEHVSKYTTDTTRLLEDLRESLQDCLSSTECCLPTLVAAVVEEVASLRAASQLAAEEQKHRDHELDALRTLLQEASAVFSDTSTFRSTQSPNFLAKCMAYAKECARLTAPECELSSAFGAASAQRPSLEDAPFSLGDRAAELQRDGVELREVEALKLQGLVCTLSVEVLLAEERAARSIMVAEEATSRLHVLCDPQLRELGFLVERVLARAATTEAQCAQKTAQHCSILAAQEPLAITASGLVSVQEDCCRALVESEGDASCAAAPTRFKPETLNILEQEAVLVPRVVQAHGRLTATCAVLRRDLDAAKAVYEQALAEVQAELDIARSRSTELEAHLEHVFDAIEALGSLLFPHEEASLRDASCLPRLAEASGQLVRTAAADAAARCRLEKDACDAAAAFAELQRQCAAAEGNVETLKETVRRYERQEADEIQTLKASAKTAAEAYAGMVTALCLSAELVPSAASAAAAVSEKQWAAVVHAVQAAVEEGGRQTSDAAELRVEMTILQSRMVELKAAVLEAEAREGNLLQRLNALMMSSGPLKAAVTAVMASRECDLESLEDVALAMHAAVQLVERQQGNMNQLIAGGGDLRSDAESLHGRLCGVAEECGVARPSLASLEETHGMLQRRMAQLERHVHDTISTVDRRAAAVLGEAESRRLDKGTPADCLDGIAYLADALACRAEECDAAKAQLLAWRAEARDREEANLRNTTRLSTLWHAFRTALLPQLVDEPADRGGCGEVEVFSADAVEFLASEAETRQAIQMIIDTAERLRRTHDDLQAVYAALRGHFGGDATTAVCDGTATPHAPARALHNSGVTSLRFDDTVTATLHLVSTVVNAKCTSVTEFIDLVVSDVLRDTSGSARVLFATLRPGAFAERLQGVLASLRTLRESSDQNGDRARRLPAFMDALVETIHSHGGRVDVTSSDATGDLTIADATMPYRHDSATTFEDCQAREQRAIVHGLQALLNQQEERARALTAEWQCVTTQYHQLSQEQVAAEETVVELRRRVQFKLQEDSKLEESLRELDSHLDQQARELSMRYFADQDAIVRRFTLLRDQIHAAMRLPTRRSASAIPPRTPGRDTSTPRS